MARLGDHLADVAWLPRDFVDPFGRSASVMPWDRSDCGGAPCGHVLNDARAYDVGLSDDAGGGNPLCLASKARAAPTAKAVGRVDEYIQWTLYGVKPDTAKPPLKSLQIREEEGGAVDGVRMTMFYYDDDLGNSSSGHFEWNYTEASPPRPPEPRARPPLAGSDACAASPARLAPAPTPPPRALQADKCHLPFGGPTWCMTEDMSNATYRGFNYPHQIASYWAMYHAARHTKLPTRMPWHWYLHRAAKTTLKLGTASVGFMDGTVAREVLDALTVEGAAGNATLAGLADAIRANMLQRQQGWARTPYPYGSEFGFDTTGQEEVVVWNMHAARFEPLRVALCVASARRPTGAVAGTLAT